MLLVTVCNCKPLPTFAQLQIYQFEQIDSLQKIQPRPVFIFIYTTWCKYCAAMEQITLKDKSNIVALNEKYYCILLDAETKQDIFFNNHLFKYRATGDKTGSHELAEQLAFINGQIAFPTICILNLKKEIIFQHSNYISSADLKPILCSLSDHK